MSTRERPFHPTGGRKIRLGELQRMSDAVERVSGIQGDNLIQGSTGFIFRKDNEPWFWAKLTNKDASTPKKYSWTEVIPDGEGGWLEPGGAPSGNETSMPAYEANDVDIDLTDDVYVQMYYLTTSCFFFFTMDGGDGRGTTVDVKGGTTNIASFAASTIDFDQTYTTITNSPTGEANVALQVASATTGGVLTNAAQEIAGVKSLIDNVRFPSLGANSYFVYGDEWPDGSGFATYTFHIARQTMDTTFLPGYTVSRISLGRTPYETIEQTGAILLDVQNFDNSQNTSIELKYNEILFKGSYSYPLIRFNVGSEYKTGQTGTDVFGTVHQSGILVEYGTGGSQGDIIYRSDFSSGWQRLSPGTSGQFLQTQGPGANPLWADAPDSGSGDTSGPSSSVDGEIALFDGTTGKLLKRATGSGGVEATSGVYSTYALTAAGKALLDDADATAQRTTLGLGTLATLSSVTTTEIAAATLVTEAEGISSNDNDTTLPTSAAVKDYVDTAVSAGSGAPVGAIVMYGGSDTPTGWLRCDGSAVSRTTYAALFAVIGTTWGAGNGSTSFNLPNFAGRSPIGQGTGSGLTNRVQGTVGGTETHTLTTAQMPAHTHGPASDSDGFWDYFASVATLQGGSTYGAAARSATGSTGGGGSHPNMHPWLAISFLIKT